MKRRGAEPEKVKQMVPALFRDLFDRVSVLSNYGFRQEQSYNSSSDFEDAQIAVESRSLQGTPVKLVTEDTTFDTLGEVSALSPAEAQKWVERDPDVGKTSIEEIAAEHDIAVIEGAAQSFGATQDGVRAGARGEIGCTSFFPAKPFGCYGDGGACFTDDAELADKMRAIRTHGGEKRHHHPFAFQMAQIS